MLVDGRPVKSCITSCRTQQSFIFGQLTKGRELMKLVGENVPTLQGIGGALFEGIEFENGKILNPRFSRYPVPRFSDVPKMETILMNRQDLPSAGAGESPIVVWLSQWATPFSMPQAPACGPCR
jgi:hypothetical protein